ncbi:MAG: hypothetical protein WKF59_13305 [Chitinophagaceae bacterium]
MRKGFLAGVSDEDAFTGKNLLKLMAQILLLKKLMVIIQMQESLPM